METKVTKILKEENRMYLIKSETIGKKKSTTVYTQTIPLPGRGGLIFREN
ncbi:hypothetical protein [Chryseobacterium sp. CCH4-E10]|nr:hypothetical protein [Chryseobacterium sp. CCH4-E10]